MPSARALWSLMLAMTPVAIAEFDQCARPSGVWAGYDQVTTTAHDPCACTTQHDSRATVVPAGFWAFPRLRDCVQRWKRLRGWICVRHVPF
jgi:hypothetical protein